MSVITMHEHDFLVVIPHWVTVIKGDEKTLPKPNTQVMVVDEDGRIAFAHLIRFDKEEKAGYWACSVDDFQIKHWSRLVVGTPVDLGL